MVGTLEALKKLVGKEYKMKALRDIKTIIDWQIIRDPVVRIIKIDLLIFIRNLIIEERFIDCNTNVIPIKPDQQLG